MDAIQLCIDITVKSYTLMVSYYHHAETRPVLGFLCLFLLSFLHTVYITRIVSIDCHTFVFRSLMKSGTGEQLYDSASRTRLPDLPAFALECLPNRNSLLYGDLYGIQNEASTIFRGTLRYEGMYV